MANMDFYTNKGTDIKGNLEGAVENVKDISDEFKELKEGISDMPDGMDSDLLDKIKEAGDQGKEQATADIESIKSSTVADAKKAADSVKSDINQKISANKTAQDKISSIRSKYGRSALDRASEAISQNTDMGNDLKKMLDDAVNDTDNTIQDIKNSL